MHKRKKNLDSIVTLFTKDKSKRGLNIKAKTIKVWMKTKSL